MYMMTIMYIYVYTKCICWRYAYVIHECNIYIYMWQMHMWQMHTVTIFICGQMHMWQIYVTNVYTVVQMYRCDECTMWPNAYVTNAYICDKCVSLWPSYAYTTDPPHPGCIYIWPAAASALVTNVYVNRHRICDKYDMLRQRTMQVCLQMHMWNALYTSDKVHFTCDEYMWQNVYVTQMYMWRIVYVRIRQCIWWQMLYIWSTNVYRDQIPGICDNMYVTNAYVTEYICGPKCICDPNIYVTRNVYICDKWHICSNVYTVVWSICICDKGWKCWQDVYVTKYAWCDQI